MSRRRRKSLITRRQVLAVLCTALFIAGSLWFYQQLDKGQWFKIKLVEVHGQLHNTAQKEIVEIVSPHLATSFFTLDLSTIQNQVQQLPWVAKAKVKRQWPLTLAIDVTEHTVIARWGESGLLNTGGEVISPPDMLRQANLPMLFNAKGRPSFMLEKYMEILERLKPNGLGVAKLVVGKDRVWQLTLDNGLKLFLGKQLAYERLDRFLLAYRETFAQHARGIEYVDLRYTNGIAIGWRRGLKPKTLAVASN